MQVIEDRLAQYSSPDLLPNVMPKREMLRNKAISIMRVNALAKEGSISQFWSTPDRMPHTWMWLVIYVCVRVCQYFRNHTLR